MDSQYSTMVGGGGDLTTVSPGSPSHLVGRVGCLCDLWWESLSYFGLTLNLKMDVDIRVSSRGGKDRGGFCLSNLL